MTPDAPIPAVIWISAALNGIACAVPYPRPTACCLECATARVRERLNTAIEDAAAMLGVVL